MSRDLMRAAPSRPSRRRFLKISAAFLGGAVLASTGPASSALAIQQWSGQALGAHTTIRLAGASPETAAAAFAAVEAEVARLEGLFSLYRTDSLLARLNRDGSLAAPPADLLDLLTEARAAWRATGGLFDPTVQPLFDLYARHFSAPDADPAGPARDALDRALDTIGFADVDFDEDAIRLRRPGMALTFNGIAQGFITDRIADLLRARGFANMLLDLGEIRASGSGRAGQGWPIRVETSDIHLDLRDQAVATSRPLGTVLDAQGRFGHIFDPRRGFVATEIAQATVIAPRAAEADALSTAAALMPRTRLDRLQRPDLTILTL
ncbi:FAD:protein FMN transferase [Oryzibacter oryziterrae]|uniref:FAD:protein FMN transferase n=1 Tax=Oryzibacter oryziterrae TaxID=2766474 RepID=UPI001F007B6F|nr:FAD:protein FMN transferase [Oryzibacter oryziterrae]